MRLLLSSLLLAVPSLAAADGVSATVTAERGNYELGAFAGDQTGVRASVGADVGRYRIAVEYALASMSGVVPMQLLGGWSPYAVTGDAHRVGVSLRARELFGTPLFVEAGGHRERTQFASALPSWRDLASATAGLSFANARGVGVELGVRTYVGPSDPMLWSGWGVFPAADDRWDTSIMAYAGITLGR